MKGRGTVASREREATVAFRTAKQHHPGVESAIHTLQCHGLARVRVRGPVRFERTVALSILATNIHRLGKLLNQPQLLKKRRRLDLALAA